MLDKSDEKFVRRKIISDKKLCPTKNLSKDACTFMPFHWKKVTKFVKVTKILSGIILSDKVEEKLLRVEIYRYTCTIIHSLFLVLG